MKEREVYTEKVEADGKRILGFLSDEDRRDLLAWMSIQKEDARELERKYGERSLMTTVVGVLLVLVIGILGGVYLWENSRPCPSLDAERASIETESRQKYSLLYAQWLTTDNRIEWAETGDGLYCIRKKDSVTAVCYFP